MAKWSKMMDEWFQHHKSEAYHEEQYENITLGAKHFSRVLEENIPGETEKQLAFEKLMNCVTWACSAIANETDPTITPQNYAIIRRSPSTDFGTFGVFMAHRQGKILSRVTLELPWRDNQRNISCIPTGSYQCSYVLTGKNIGAQNHWYLLSAVSGRSGILIHPGNWAGDEALGLRTDSQGCILMGSDEGSPVVPGKGAQRGVVSSRIACGELVDFFDSEPFRLSITDSLPAKGRTINFIGGKQND